MAGEDLIQRFGKDFPANHVLFKDGEAGKEMFVIQTGKIRISKTVRGVEKTLVTLGPGEFFGEMSILNNHPRSATATVEEASKLLVIEPKVFEAMVRGNAEISVRMIKKLAARLREADEQIENLLLRDHNSRVVHYLTHHADRSAKKTAEGLLIDLTAKELAGKIGLDVEPVQEVLNKLVRGKLLTMRDSGGLLLHDVAKLQAFLEFLEMKERFGDV